MHTHFPFALYIKKCITRIFVITFPVCTHISPLHCTLRNASPGFLSLLFTSVWLSLLIHSGICFVTFSSRPRVWLINFTPKFLSRPLALNCQFLFLCPRLPLQTSLSRHPCSWSGSSCTCPPPLAPTRRSLSSPLASSRA